MSDPVSLASLFDAAEQAAMGGDFAAASRLLAEAAHAQEATLGPDHLDLANTLNNLAVAHERCGQLDAAEREYRRAYAIAARTRPADDPLVTTSAQNLRDFCQANGRSVDGPALRLPDDGAPGADAARAVAMAVPSQADVPTAPIDRLPITFAKDAPPASKTIDRQTPAAQTPVAPPPVAAAPVAAPAAPAQVAAARPRRAPAPPPAPAVPARRLPIPVLIALGAIAALVIWLLAGRGPGAPPATPEAAAPDPPVAVPAPAGATPSPAPAPAPAATVAPAPGPLSPARSTASAPPAAAGNTPPAEADGVAVGDAKLCTSLSSDYRCDPAGATVPPGRLVFYTRLVAPRDTSVVHRWYRGSELRQSVRLDVPARRQGFRTYSRGTVSVSDGEWRVELRSRDGRILHTERFSVR